MKSTAGEPVEVRALARPEGVDCEVSFDPSLYKREPLETVSYCALRAVPPLQRILPCTAAYHFTKT